MHTRAPHSRLSAHLPSKSATLNPNSHTVTPHHYTTTPLHHYTTTPLCPTANDYWQYTAGTCAPAATGLTDQDRLELNLPPRTAGYPTTDPADLAAGPVPPWPSCPARFTVVPDTG